MCLGVATVYIVYEFGVFMSFAGASSIGKTFIVTGAC